MPFDSAQDVSFPDSADEQRRLIASIVAARAGMRQASETLRQELLAFSDLIDGRGTEEIPELQEEEPGEDDSSYIPHIYGYRSPKEYKRHTWCYSPSMKTYTWNPEKNEPPKADRGISFEDIVLNIQLGNEIDVFEHPNQDRYPGQHISVVLMENYAYLVPFVENEDEIFLKTIIPSRRATKKYVGETNG